jgi:GTP-binding protein
MQISIADLPGLLPDLTRGFGTKYLQHLDRCKMILLVLDLSQVDEKEPYEQYKQMINALNSFDESLLQRKQLIIVGNKVDSANAMDNLLRLNQLIDQVVIPISTKEKINLKKFMKILRAVYEKNGNKEI